jgi:hypothetical protein
MNLPEEFRHRVCKTKLSGFGTSFKRLDEIRKEWQGSEIDVIYEGIGLTHRPVVVVIFETSEDCLAFTLKYGNEYV